MLKYAVAYQTPIKVRHPEHNDSGEDEPGRLFSIPEGVHLLAGRGQKDVLGTFVRENTFDIGSMVDINWTRHSLLRSSKQMTELTIFEHGARDLIFQVQNHFNPDHISISLFSPAAPTAPLRLSEAIVILRNCCNLASVVWTFEEVKKEPVNTKDGSGEPRYVALKIDFLDTLEWLRQVMLRTKILNLRSSRSSEFAYAGKL